MLALNLEPMDKPGSFLMIGFDDRERLEHG
jgi:hypothetical protein